MCVRICMHIYIYIYNCIYVTLRWSFRNNFQVWKPEFSWRSSSEPSNSIQFWDPGEDKRGKQPWESAWRHRKRQVAKARKHKKPCHMNFWRWEVERRSDIFFPVLFLTRRMKFRGRSVPSDKLPSRWLQLLSKLSRNKPNNDRRCNIREPAPFHGFYKSVATVSNMLQSMIQACCAVKTLLFAQATGRETCKSAWQWIYHI